MKIIAIVAALPLMGAAPPQGPAPGKSKNTLITAPTTPVDCNFIHEAKDRDAPPRARVMPLNEAPAGQAYYAVWRTDENGCSDPMLVSGERFGH